jgi:hypothetical protein
MARAKIVRHWGDDDYLVVEIGVEGSYPDAVAEARACVRGLYAEALDITLADADAETPDPDVI